MKIAIFTDTFFPQINGVSHTLNKMQQFMIQNNIEYRFFIPCYDERTAHSSSSNIISFPNIPFFLYPECKFSFPSIKVIHQVIASFQPDLIHVITPFPIGFIGAQYAKIYDIPLVCSYHTDFPSYLKFYRLTFLEEMIWKFFKWFHSYSNLNLVPSTETAQQLKQKGINDIQIWSRGIDCNDFSPVKRNEEVRKQYGIEDEFVLLYVGRLAVEKELDVLLKAVQILYTNKMNFKILFVGEGPLSEELKASQIPNIIYTGYKQKEELQQIYAASDLFVFPSRYETYGNAVLEAMASGLPVIAPFSGGIKENLINGYNGLIFEAGNWIDFAEKIQQLYQEPTLIKEMRIHAREHALRRNWKDVFAKLFTDYQKVIDDHQYQKQGLSA